MHGCTIGKLPEFINLLQRYLKSGCKTIFIYIVKFNVILFSYYNVNHHNVRLQYGKEI
jgi:hypothetical protein